MKIQIIIYILMFLATIVDLLFSNAIPYYLVVIVLISLFYQKLSTYFR